MRSGTSGAAADNTHVGFIGLGTMGEAMARNLAQAGIALTVWNRTPEKARALASDGVRVVDSPDEVFAATDAVILLLVDGRAMNDVLGRHTPQFHSRVAGHTIVHMGTTSRGTRPPSPTTSALPGGAYVEAPVSGSRKQAESRDLVVMLAGDRADVERVRPLVEPVDRSAVDCGQVPGALTMKLSINVHLINMVTGLAEAFHFATAHGLDLHRFAEVLNDGPMASPVSKIKLAKLLDGDFAAQASIANVLNNAELIVGAARAQRLATPLLKTCRQLYAATAAAGRESQDMAAVVHAIATHVDADASSGHDR